MAEDIVVIGAGGFGRETLDVVEAINDASAEPVWRIYGVVDDAPARIQQDRLRAREIPLLGGMDVLRNLLDRCHYVVGIGAPAVRARIVDTVDRWGGRAATLVHPHATVGSQTSIGPGAIVCGGVQLSTNVRFGRHVHVNPGAIIGHDSALEDFVSVNPRGVISGEVRLRRESLIGAGATVLQGLEVGKGAVVGAAACVTKNIDSGAIVVGVPARKVETK